MTESQLLSEGAFTQQGLHVPAPSAVAALARDRLVQARAARLRLGLPDDREALHDFRVGLRRVRSLLRGYRPVVREFIGAGLRRRLRRVARASNASRDLEVKLAWLAAVEPDLRPRDRVGLRWFQRRLEAQKADADRRMRREVERHLEPVLGELDGKLLELSRAGSPEQPPLARVSAERLEGFLHAFDHRLEAVRSIMDQARAHRARIAGKRVRYLLEPLAGALPEAQESVDRFKQLQDLLGEMHDADVLARAIAQAMEDASAERGRRVAARVRDGEPLDRAALRRERRRDPMPGLLALGELAQQRRERAWGELETTWLAHREERLLDPVAAMVSRLSVEAGRGVEIERKFLLRQLPPALRDTAGVDIDQGYLPGIRIQERLRRVREGDTVRWYRTFKEGTGLVRSEVEEETSGDMFDTMWPLTEGRRVRKRRYRVMDNGLLWEVDEFTDRDLVLAEVELGSADQAVRVPEWLSPHVEREVTEEEEYENYRLAQ